MSVFVIITLATLASGGEEPRLPKPVVGPEWKSVEESIVLPTGIKAYATYHFNRNALADACMTDDGLLAVTRSGNLLRFDLKNLHLQQEIWPESAFTILAEVDGIGILAACADGNIFRIDPKTLRQTEFAKLNAAPDWMTGFHDAKEQKKGVLAVVVSRNEIELHRLGFEQPSSEKYYVPPPLVPMLGGISEFLLDRKSRLWLGRVGGEWGGWYGSLDLNAGKAGKVESPTDTYPSGVHGFIELTDGQIWAYGGMRSLGFSTGFIARVDRGKFEPLGSYENFPEAGSPPKRPQSLITHIIPDPKGDGLLVFTNRELFRVDAKLANWRYLGSIGIRNSWGRSDAVDLTPELRSVLAAGDKSGDLLCPTASDGLLRIREGQVTQYMVPGQIGDNYVHTILPASGISLVHGEALWRHTGENLGRMVRGDDLWKFTEGRWQAISLFPPSHPDSGETWDQYCLMSDTDRRPVALCRSDGRPSAWALSRLKDGKVEVLASGNGADIGFNVKGFATPDGNYWCSDWGKLRRLVDGKWQHVGKAPDSSVWHYRVIGEGNPPWTLLSRDGLFRLSPGKRAEDAVLTPIPQLEKLGTIHDALALKTGQILLASTAGLRLFDEPSGKVSECPFAQPQGKVRALCRDGRGRTWLVGNGIWMVDAKGKIHDLGKLNRYGTMASAIGADSSDATGVIVGLGRRGVLFVRAGDTDR
ncbi:MAG TPA: hypothetical protein VG097_19425 [Gemmata sp.]|nr:hypothetical protein [Gemmata sp.]